ncbi:DNA replication/repair protein RecF [Liberiplasma polymorphum]|uniref:DNA replication/repair protein RecF n=1 Tax=Liberiplasma polymorphum TaxID=3374570 RepID=UPI003773E394
MIIKQLELSSFRIYNTLNLEFHPNLNIIIGDNAQGKTSILEAIHLLGLTKSHKLSKDEDIIQKGAEYAKISALCDFKDKKTQLNMVLSKGGKKVKYNRIEMTKLSDYIGLLNVVMFSPEDLDLIKGAPLERRRFLDLEIGQLSKNYINDLTHYRRLLKERNDVLKGISLKKFDHITLEVITDQLIHYAEKIVTKRKTFIESLNNHLTETIPLISEEDPVVKIVYEPSIEKDFKKALEKKEPIDILTGSTSLGPHRDDYGFYYDDDVVKNFASQGQIRTIVLALKLAVTEMIFAKRGHYPIVLLDDVFSELDYKRQESIIYKLNKNAQIFITTTDLNQINKKYIKESTVFEIHAGKIKGVKHHG